MHKTILFKLWVASLCALVACGLPVSMGKPHEVSFGAVRSYKPVQPLSAPKVQLASELQPVVVPAPSAPPVAASPVIGCGSDPLMAVIYQKESGCSTGAINPSGCEGLGQECGHKYDKDHPYTCSLYDWACQDAWFRDYAVRAYGSIYSAYLFRISHNYW